MSDATDLYLDLLARTLTRALFEDNDRVLGVRSYWWKVSRAERALERLAPWAARRGFEIVRKQPYDEERRRLGRDWPARAETMAGLMRLENVRQLIEAIVRDDVPGDLIETGVWRGGTCIFMKGVLKAHGISDRAVWLADSFAGLPPPNMTDYPADAAWDLSSFDYLAVSREQVEANFRRYGLLDEGVRFLEGWFHETLPAAPVDRLAILRLDGDLYESTIVALTHLYPKLSPGGYCIVDDYGNIEACQKAVHDYRSANGIDDAIVDIDGYAVYWRRS